MDGGSITQKHRGPSVKRWQRSAGRQHSATRRDAVGWGHGYGHGPRVRLGPAVHHRPVVGSRGGTPWRQLELTGEQSEQRSWPRLATWVAPGGSGGDGERDRGHNASGGAHHDGDGGGDLHRENSDEPKLTQNRGKGHEDALGGHSFTF